MTKLTPTNEQTIALQMFRSGESLAIEAGAGTGKTATLVMLAEDAPNRRGQYVAFNKAIVVESGEKMPRNVACNTAHSLAFRAMRSRCNMDRLRSPRMRSIDLANRLALDALKITAFDGSRKTLSRSFLAGLTMSAVTRFCQTADEEPTRRHVPWVEGIDAPVGDGRSATRTRTNNDAVAKHVETAMRTAWADLQDKDGSLPFRHDHYLKMWQLNDPRIDADFILFDEAQDANPVMVAIVAAQTHAQLVFVGDSQQAIYEFTGAVNALANVPAERRAFLTQSFRFGPAIAAKANDVLAMIRSAELRLSGTESIDSVVEPVAEPSVILARTNATAVRAVLDAQSFGTSVHLVGGGREIVSFARAAERLMDGLPVDHPELACFDSWTEVQEYVDQDEQGSELRLMVTLVNDFGVPTILSALDSMTREDAAELIVSTAHKSKGREWDSVRLATDFTITRDGESRLREGDSELRLLYVAVTRARLRLDVSAVAVLDESVAVDVATPENSSYDVVEVDPAPSVGVASALESFVNGPSRDERLTTWLALGGTVETFDRLARGRS